MRAKFLLCSWLGYMECSKDLNEYQKKDATILFNSLKQLDKEEVDFLADKYVKNIAKRCYGRYNLTFHIVPKTDKEMGKVYGMDEKAYRTKRAKLENKLQRKINKTLIDYKEKQIEQQERFCLSMDNLYLKDYRLSIFGARIQELSFTADPSTAKVFLKNEKVDEVRLLMQRTQLKKAMCIL